MCSSQAAPSRPILLESCGGQGMLGETHSFIWCCWGCKCRNATGKADTPDLGAGSGSLGLLYHKSLLPLELFVMQFGLNMANTAFSLTHLRPKVYCMAMRSNFTYKYLFWQKFKHRDLTCFTAQNLYFYKIPIAINIWYTTEVICRHSCMWARHKDNTSKQK